MGNLEIVVGAQFGSEAKGHVVQRLTERAQRSVAMTQVIRVAGPNAGHTGYDPTGQSWALRQVPVAAVTSGPAVLGIAAGSEIDLPVLLDEHDRLHAAGQMVNKMLWVSGEATMITDAHKEEENMPSFNGGGEPQEGTDLVSQIGSTGKGIGAARADRLMRSANRLLDDKTAQAALADRGIGVAPPWHDPIANYSHTIIEGTQGYGLGLHAGFYPKCTSSDCRAIDFLAMAGISPWAAEKVDIWAVARMYPIRVAGNSGPLKDETTWEELGLPEELTTVTKKVRRVGMPDWGLVREAVVANGGGSNLHVAVTMVDQMFPHMANIGLFDADAVTHDDAMLVTDYIKFIERTVGARVGLVTTGPNTATFTTREP